MALKDTIQDDMKQAMKARDKERLGALRMLIAAIKQVEIDSREECSDEDVLRIVEKQIKQRKESAAQYADAGRTESEQQELAEAEVFAAYLPEQLGEEELAELIKAAIAETGAASMRDMGQVMGVLRPQIQGKADMGSVSAQVKALLNS